MQQSFNFWIQIKDVKIIAENNQNFGRITHCIELYWFQMLFNHQRNKNLERNAVFAINPKKKIVKLIIRLSQKSKSNQIFIILAALRRSV